MEYIIQENGTEAILTMFSYLIVQSKESLCSSKNSTVIWVSPGELSDEKQLGQAVIERQNHRIKPTQTLKLGKITPN